MSAPSRVRRVGFAVAAAVLGLVVGFAIGEVGLRLFRPQIFPVHPPGMYTLDPHVGYVLTPGYEGELERAEFRHGFRVDDRGARVGTGREPADDALRVLVLGDSQAFGFGVEDDETFAAVLERELDAARPDRDVAVFNAAVPGYGTADELAFLEAHGERFAPDVVVVQFLSSNDPTDNRNPASTWATLRDGMLGARERADGSRAGAELSVLKRLKRHSHLVHLASNTAGYLAMRAGFLGEDDRIDGGPVDDADLERTRELLERLVERARTLGAATVLVHSTGQAGILSDRYRPARAAASVRDAALHTGAIWVDAARALHAREDRGALYYPRDGHWTRDGHRAIAELLVDPIARLLDARATAPAPLADGVPTAAEWVDTGREIVSQGPEGAWDHWLVGGFAFAVYPFSDRTHLYYQGASAYREIDQSVTGRAIGLAVARGDGPFVEHPENPVLTYSTASDASGEEGAVSIAIVPDGDGLLAFYGANSELDATQVRADARIARSSDGVRFVDEGEVLHHDDPSVWGAGDELFPIAAARSGDRVHVYYVTNGVEVDRTLGVAWGEPRPGALRTGPVLAPDGLVPAWGTASLVRLPDGPRLAFVNDVRKPRLEVRAIAADRPDRMSTPIATYRFEGVQQAFVWLDLERGEWRMIYRRADGTGYGEKVAPYAPAGETP